MSAPDPHVTPHHDFPTDSAEVPVPVAVPGYELLGRLGAGGMGVVYRARHLALGREVALKMPLGGEAAGHRDLVRFLAEAEAAAAVDHPHVVRVYDVSSAGGRPYLAMELCPGGTLANRLKAGRLPPAEAAGLARKVSAGVAAAHAAGVVHRDLKPGNVLFDTAGEPKVADFGLAKRGAGADLTRTAVALGTPHYMAPEQAGGGSKFAGPPADVWALGVILYECLTGRPPFDGGNLMSILSLVLHAAPARPREVVPGVPRGLELVCLKCLEKDPADRYPTAAEVSADLGRYLSGEPVSVRAAGVVERAAKWARRKPTAAAAWGLAVLAGVLLVVAGGAAWLYHRAEAARAAAEVARGEATDQKAAAEAARDGEAAAKRDAEAARDRLARVEYARTIQVAHQAWRDHNVGVARQLLAGTRPEFRGWEYDYVHRLCHSDLVTLAGHTGPVAAAVFSQDGRRVLAVSRDRTVREWDPDTGEELRKVSLEGPAKDVLFAAFSPDRRRVVMSGTCGTAWVWDADSGRPLHALTGHSGWCCSARFSPDGRRIVTANGASDDQTAVQKGAVRVWDAETGKELVTLAGAPEAPGFDDVRSAAFSPDGRRVVTTGSGVSFWDAQAGKELLNLPEAPDGVVDSAEYSSDGRRVVTAGVDAVRIWDAESGKELLTIRRPVHHYSAAFSANGRRVITQEKDGPVRVWDAESGRELLALAGHTSVIYSAALSPDGRRIVTAARDGTARVWDAESRKDYASFPSAPKRGWLAAFWPDGNTGPESDAERVRELLSAVTVPSGLDPPSEFSPGKRWRLVCEDGTAAVCDVASGKQVAAFTHDGTVLGAQFSPDGRRVLTEADDGTARVWDVQTGKELLTLPAEPVSRSGAGGITLSARFSPDGRRVIVALKDRTVCWDAQTGKELYTLDVTDAPYGLAFSQDGRRCAAADGKDGTARVWDAESGKQLLVLRHSTDILLVLFSPDGRVVTGDYDGTVRMWDASSGKELLALTGHSAHVGAAGFSADGRQMLTASHDRTARLWDLVTGQELIALRHPDEVLAAVFAPDGRRILTRTLSQTDRVFDTAPVNRAFRPREPAPPPRAK